MKDTFYIFIYTKSDIWSTEREIQKGTTLHLTTMWIWITCPLANIRILNIFSYVNTYRFIASLWGSHYWSITQCLAITFGVFLFFSSNGNSCRLEFFKERNGKFEEQNEGSDGGVFKDVLAEKENYCCCGRHCWFLYHFTFVNRQFTLIFVERIKFLWPQVSI